MDIYLAIVQIEKTFFDWSETLRTSSFLLVESSCYEGD